MQPCNRSKSPSSHHSGIWVLKYNCLVYKNWQPRHKPLFTISFILSLSFIMQAPSHITTFLSQFHFKKSYILASCLRVYSDRTRQRHYDGVKHNALELEHMFVNRSIQTGRVASKIYTIETPLKYSQRPVAMVQYGIITYIRCLDTADYYHQCGRRNAGRTSAITYDLKCIVNRWQTKLSHLGRWIRPKTLKTVHTTCAQSKTLKIKYQMFLTVPWRIFIFVKIARHMFCIFKSNYIVSYNSF